MSATLFSYISHKPFNFLLPWQCCFFAANILVWPFTYSTICYYKKNLSLSEQSSWFPVTQYTVEYSADVSIASRSSVSLILVIICCYSSATFTVSFLTFSLWLSENLMVIELFWYFEIFGTLSPPSAMRDLPQRCCEIVVRLWGSLHAVCFSQPQQNLENVWYRCI